MILLLSACCVSNSSAQVISGPADGKLFVKVTRNRELSGAAVSLDEISFKAEFGQVSIPMSKIAGIKLHVNADDDAVIALKNGDLVTGEIGLKQVTLKTSWGKAHVKLDQLKPFLLTQNHVSLLKRVLAKEVGVSQVEYLPRLKLD